MLKRKEIGKILILVLLVSMLSVAFASAAADKLNDSENTGEIADSNISHSYFEECKIHPLFIASRGNFPETTDLEWEKSVTRCYDSITKMGPSYTIDSSIKGIFCADELLEVHLGSAYKGKMNESKIDEIYRKINKQCEQEEGISDIPVVFMWAQDEEDMPLPDYGPEIFEEAKSGSSFIAAYGTMPIIKEKSEKLRWTDLLGHTKDRELDPFFAEFGGPVVSYGVSINGYLSVGMNSDTPEKVNESVINEIYQTINKHFEQEASMEEVPVLFEWGRSTIPTDAVCQPPIQFDENQTSKDEKSTPGFGLILMIVGIIGAALFAKRHE
ncbi:PGF-CTERM sorting domain-containing protein [Methanococcoides sp. AM1]|uniref:PGF-CTERM sorting domain-containing protein n=1 Tax=Methanococcoides sp. AM1 TaxID=1201011 RepID=UPI0010826695|nr:PGF-CTERM sorting domain-containing protein [Methanococcoides sp. AM1]